MTGMTTTSFSGADVDQLMATAAACTHGAETLVGVANRTTLALCVHLTWHGPDADAMRAQWREETLPAIVSVATRVREAGLHLVREAQQQLDTSAAGTGAAAGAATSAPVGAGAGSAGTVGAEPRDLAAELADLRDALLEVPGQLMNLRILAELSAAGGTAGDLAAAVARAESMGSAFERLGLDVLGAYSTATGIHDTVAAARAGDVAGAIENGAPLVFTAMGPGYDATLGTAWTVGSAVGTVLYEGMQGTRYGDIVQSMTEGAFESNGAWGMVQVPGLLGFAAYEYLTEDAPDDR